MTLTPAFTGGGGARRGPGGGEMVSSAGLSLLLFAVFASVAPARAADPPAPAKKAEAPKATQQPPMGDNDRLKNEIRGVLSYLDKLLESLPESKIDEFAHSEYFDTYKKLFEELGLV